METGKRGKKNFQILLKCFDTVMNWLFHLKRYSCILPKCHGNTFYSSVDGMYGVTWPIHRPVKMTRFDWTEEEMGYFSQVTTTLDNKEMKANLILLWSIFLLCASQPTLETHVNRNFTLPSKVLKYRYYLVKNCRLWSFFLCTHLLLFKEPEPEQAVMFPVGAGGDIHLRLAKQADK